MSSIGRRQPGDWGGLILVGRGIINRTGNVELVRSLGADAVIDAVIDDVLHDVASQDQKQEQEQKHQQEQEHDKDKDKAEEYMVVTTSVPTEGAWYWFSDKEAHWQVLHQSEKEIDNHEDN